MSELDQQGQDWIDAAEASHPDLATGLGVVTVRFLMSQAHELRHIEQRLRAIEAALADAKATPRSNNDDYCGFCGAGGGDHFKDCARPEPASEYGRAVERFIADEPIRAEGEE